MNTLYGHSGEIVAAEFSKKNADLICTASMDGTARVFHVETAQEINLFNGHEAEVISCHFNKDGNLLVTGSFDETGMIWDVRMKEYYFSVFNLKFVFHSFQIISDLLMF